MIHFEIEDVGDIGALVHYPATTLATAAQGLASMGVIAVRDIGVTRASFPTGKRIKVWRNSDAPIYSGYLMNAGRRFWFDYDKPETLNRLWMLQVVDINILFSKRVVEKKSHPATIEGPVYNTDTYDDVVLARLFADWLDLSTDDLDTSSGIERVAHINAGQPAYPFNGGQYWVQAMQGIAGLPAAIFYIDPDRVVRYSDVDHADAPFDLSDRPEGWVGSGGGGGGPATTADTFGRTESSGWGTGPLGEWTDLGGGLSTSVAPGTAFSTGSNSVQMTIPTPASGTNGEVRMRFKWASSFNIMELVLGTGFPYGSNFADFFMQRDAGQVEIDTEDDFTTGACPTFSPGDVVWMALRIEADGTVRVKTWLASGSEPDWQATLPTPDTIAAFTQINIVQTGIDDWEFYEVSFTTDTEGGGGGATGDVGAVGYREITIIEDGAQLANDFTGRGFGKGRNHGVYNRLIDDDSVALHGLWQDADTHYDVWKQSTIDRIVDAAVNGSPSSHRGRKDDRVEVPITTFHHGFRAGQKVRLINHAHDFDDVIPIRTMRMSFPGPDIIRYEMKLSHEIDPLFSLSDPFPYRSIHVPGYVVPPVEIIVPGVGPGDCVDGCGITDTFNRITTGGLGHASSGGLWQTFDGSDALWSTDGTAHLAIPSGAGGGHHNAYLNITAPVTEASVTVQGAGPSSGAYAAGLTLEQPIPVSGNAVNATVKFSTDGTVTLIGTPQFGTEVSDSTSLAFDVTSQSILKIATDGTNIMCKVWLVGDPEPGSWTLTVAFATGGPFDGGAVYLEGFASTSAFDITYEDLDVVGLNKCSAVQYDNFERELAGPRDWGTATPGGAVWTVTAFSNANAVVTGGYGIIFNGSTGPCDLTVEADSVPFAPGADFSVTIRFFVSSDESVLAAEFGFDGVGFQWSIDVGGGSHTNLPQLVLDDNSGHRVTVPFQTDFWDTLTGYGVFKVERVAGTARAKLWDSALTEPDWQLTATSDYVPSSPNFVGFVSLGSGVVGPASVSIDSVDFDYAGRPCFCEDAGCTIPLLTEDNLSSDWITLSEIGRWDVDGNLLRVHYDSAVDAMGSGVTIKRTLTLPADVVEAGLRLDAKFGYTSTILDPGGSPPFYKSGFMGASIKIVGGLQDFTSGEANTDIFSVGLPYGAFIAFPGAGVGHTVELGPYDWAQGVDQTISLILSPTERTARLLEQGYSVTETHSPTYPSPFGSPPMYDVDITLYGNAASDGFVPPPDGVIEDWIGIPILMDLAGQPLVIPGVQECSLGGCTDPTPPTTVIPPGGRYCEPLAYTDGTNYTTSVDFKDGTQDVFVNGELIRPGMARDYTVSGRTITLTGDFGSLSSGDKVTICYDVDTGAPT